MTEADRRGYERRLLEFFPRDTGGTALSQDPIGTLPEWLLKGTWITAPPQVVEQLPDEARSFVNEFAPAPADTMETPGAERMVGHDREAEPPPRHDESPTPPHGDKLR